MAYHGNENQGVFADGFIKAQEHTTDNTYQNGKEQNQSGPADADGSGFAHILLLAQGHEADNDVGHTKITQAPSHAGNDVTPISIRIPEVDRNFCSSSGIDEGGSKERCYQQRAQHNQALEKVGPAHSGKAAQEGVADDNNGSHIHGQGSIHADNSIEQRAAGLDAGGSVNCIGDEENYSADNLQ